MPQSGTQIKSDLKADLDALVVSTGLPAFICFIGCDFSACEHAYSRGGECRGTWYFNRYPGARCDAESLVYSYSFSEDIQNE